MSSSSTTAKTTAKSVLNRGPLPFFDTLERMGNPYRERIQSLTHLLKEASDEVPDLAIQDYQFASEFLYAYRGSADTFSTYRREIERLLHWSWLVAEKPLQSIRREDIEQYIEFARSPPPRWIGNRNVARYIDSQGQRQPNPDWRPYVVTGVELKEAAAHYVLSPSGIQAIFAVLSSFFNFLIQEEYLERNPVAQIRQKSKFVRHGQDARQIRRLTQLQWHAVLAEAKQQDARTHFIMKALFGMYLRISELVETPRWSPTMGDFQRDLDGHWWFHTVGKGNKARQIPVSDEMLQALQEYRLSRDLSALPQPGETTPLIHKFRGKGGITSTRQIRGIVQSCFDRAMARLNAQGETEEAQQLAAATVHWLRHTGISEDVRLRPREHVRDDAGHGSSAITDRYIDVELRERHASARAKRFRSS